MCKGKNIYMPLAGRINEIIKQTEDVSLFKIKTGVPLDYRPGQFFMVSVWGAGEVPISVASLKEDKYSLELCIRRVGLVTEAIHRLNKGDPVWLRGPYGNGFSLDVVREQNILIIAGGIGIVPLSPLLKYFSKKLRVEKRINLFYGCRSPEDIVFKSEMNKWINDGVKVAVTVDRADENWTGNIGRVTDLIHKEEIDLNNTIAYICGPEIMIKAVMKDLLELGIPDDRIITTLEAHMKCGVGKCGHCKRGNKFVCTDGPVFSYGEIKDLSTLSLPSIQLTI